MIKQYQVIYNSNNEQFIIHRQIKNKTDLYFKIYKTGLYYFDSRDKNFQTFKKKFVETVIKNFKNFKKNKNKYNLYKICNTR